MLVKKSQLEFITEYASKDDSRKTLTGVYFDNGSLIATNGHILGSIKRDEAMKVEDYPSIPNVVLTDTNPAPFIVPAQLLKDLAKSIKVKKSSFPILSYGAIEPPEQKQVKGYWNGLESVNTCQAETIEGTYPNYQNVLPKREASQFSITLAANYVEQVAKSFQKLGESVQLTFYCQSQNQAVLIEGSTNKGAEPLAQAVIMPVKGEGSGFNQKAIVNQWAQDVGRSYDLLTCYGS